jgi:hypothetical protein
MSVRRLSGLGLQPHECGLVDYSEISDMMVLAWLVYLA